MAIFATTFVCGAMIVFGLSSLAGSGLTAIAVSVAWRTRVGATTLVALAFIDLVAIRQNHICPLGVRRQTPALLIYRHAVPTVAAVWGFDTGLAVTTFRVAATTWGALVLAMLGLATWWTGIAYGLSFTVPLIILMMSQPVENVERLIPGRRVAQFASALLLLAGGVLLMPL